MLLNARDTLQVCVFLASSYDWVTVMHEIPISSAQTMTSFHTLELSSTIPLVPLEKGNADGEKVAVPKLLTQVCLGTIFSDIIKDNPTIKNKVGEHAFRYIISSLGSVRRFTNSYKQMCGCTECVGLHTLHCLLLAKRVVMHCQFALAAQHCTRAAQAAKKASGWAAVAWHPKPLLAITEGTCQQWSPLAVPHWECQTLQCGDCKEYSVPNEEAREDGAAEDISFHV